MCPQTVFFLSNGTFKGSTFLSLRSFNSSLTAALSGSFCADRRDCDISRSVSSRVPISTFRVTSILFRRPDRSVEGRSGVAPMHGRVASNRLIVRKRRISSLLPSVVCCEAVIATNIGPLTMSVNTKNWNMRLMPHDFGTVRLNRRSHAPLAKPPTSERIIGPPRHGNGLDT